MYVTLYCQQFICSIITFISENECIFTLQCTGKTLLPVPIHMWIQHCVRAGMSRLIENCGLINAITSLSSLLPNLFLCNCKINLMIFITKLFIPFLKISFYCTGGVFVCCSWKSMQVNLWALQHEPVFRAWTPTQCIQLSCIQSTFIAISADGVKWCFEECSHSIFWYQYMITYCIFIPLLLLSISAWFLSTSHSMSLSFFSPFFLKRKFSKPEFYWNFTHIRLSCEIWFERVCQKVFMLCMFAKISFAMFMHVHGTCIHMYVCVCVGMSGSYVRAYVYTVYMWSV